jgi:hypothetical protein
MTKRMSSRADGKPRKGRGFHCATSGLAWGRFWGSDGDARAASLAKTPNKGHGMPCASYAPQVPPGSTASAPEAEDPPTRYLANTPGDIRRLAQAAGLAVERVERVEGRPEYLRVTVPTYLAGWVY